MRGRFRFDSEAPQDSHKPGLRLTRRRCFSRAKYVSYALGSPPFARDILRLRSSLNGLPFLDNEFFSRVSILCFLPSIDARIFSLVSLEMILPLPPALILARCKSLN